MAPIQNPKQGKPDMSIMPTWKEWSEELTEDQRRYSTYKVLDSLDTMLSCQNEQCLKTALACDARMKTLERRKWMDRLMSVLFGILAGVGSTLGIKFKFPDI